MRLKGLYKLCLSKFEAETGSKWLKIIPDMTEIHMYKKIYRIKRAIDYHSTKRRKTVLLFSLQTHFLLPTQGRLSTRTHLT